ncbi:hypothetical protein TNCV_997631 [Trichonephila clavipes]|nr:hypothetical protein TNCV_997631 [Trichonephila clavipes]
MAGVVQWWVPVLVLLKTRHVEGLIPNKSIEIQSSLWRGAEVITAFGYQFKLYLTVVQGSITSTPRIYRWIAEVTWPPLGNLCQ